ncbi:MAG: SPOR domain-containing protein [Treponema sp.]|nr:SPOR domain-containing protein [Treponema sp.]
MKKSLISFFALSTILFSLSGQTKNISAKSVIETAAKKSSLTDSIKYLETSLSSVPENAEKRAVYAFLASVLEQQGLYEKAQKTFVQAASIQGSAASVVPGVPNKNSEELVIDAVRCALCAGDYSAAESYLNSAVRNSKDEKIIAYVKLYEQWSALCKAKSISDTKESIAMLKTYAGLDSMKLVRPSLLLTLWHLTGESQFSESLKKTYPKSMEASIVKGEIQTLPTPFWYFVPRNGVDLPEIAGLGEGSVFKAEKTSAQEKSASVSAAKTSSSEKSSSSAKGEKIVRQQLGLFRDEANARALCDRVAGKGFKAEITSEVRPSGTKYYLVVVNENSKGTIGEELRTAGFDCYPLFDD